MPVITFRQQLKLASASAEVVGKFRFVWKNTRKLTRWTIDVYHRCENIADKLNVDKPEPLVNMQEEN